METVLESSADRPAVDRPKDRQRSRITNGSALLPGVDGRSPWVRRCKDVIAAHLSDLGGEDNTSAAERSIIRRASVLTVELERLEARFALAERRSAERPRSLPARGREFAAAARGGGHTAAAARCDAAQPIRLRTRLHEGGCQWVTLWTCPVS